MNTEPENAADDLAEAAAVPQDDAELSPDFEAFMRLAKENEELKLSLIHI